ncbi:dolichyl-diphosphooligosaccharide--protein glycosyltransferase subunit KCP2 [Ciona intestinalis]
MAVSTSTSAVVSLTSSVLLFAGMQYFKVQLGSTEWFTILGGFIGSVLFLMLLTGVSNLENVFLDDNFQAKLFPEVLICLVLAMTASGLVHRVCVTTCFGFSSAMLYFVNQISGSMYQGAVPTTPGPKAKVQKKKKH